MWPRSGTGLLRRLRHSLEVSFDIPLLTPNFLSVRFDLWTYTGGAHHNLRIVTFNLQLSPFQSIGFADFFRPETDYLRTISEWCVSDLLRQFGMRDGGGGEGGVVKEGAGPDFKNFEASTLTRTGLLIFFSRIA